MNISSQSQKATSLGSRGRPDFISKMKEDALSIKNSLKEQKEHIKKNMSLPYETENTSIEMKKTGSAISYEMKKAGDNFLKSTIRTIKNEFQPDFESFSNIPETKVIEKPIVVEETKVIEEPIVVEKPIVVEITLKEQSFFN